MNKNTLSQVRNWVALAMLVILLSSCVPQSEHDAVKAELAEVRAELSDTKKKLDEALFGKDRLIARLDSDLKNGKWEEAKLTLKELTDRYSDEMSDYPFDEKAEQIKKGIEEAERLANLNNTGVWEIRNYQDRFGEETNIGFITNKEIISGQFSNSATTNSELAVIFLIDGMDNYARSSKNPDDKHIAIQLFEYGRAHPVKSYGSSSKYYSVSVRSGSGQTLELGGINQGDRIYLQSNIKNIWGPFKEMITSGEAVSFVIEEDSGSGRYMFKLESTKWLDNALRILDEQNNKQGS